MISLKYQDAVKSQARENTDCFEFSKEFVRKSVEGYRVGLDMFEAESQGIVFEWTKWRNSKYFMEAKSEELLEWRHYIENNQNAWEVAKHIPKEDLIVLDLSRGFTFDYPELDISNIPKDSEYERTIKRFASDYCMLMEKFIQVEITLLDILLSRSKEI